MKGSMRGVHQVMLLLLTSCSVGAIALSQTEKGWEVRVEEGTYRVHLVTLLLLTFCMSSFPRAMSIFIGS